MGFGDLGGMGVGSNARKREECQSDQCLIRVGGNWNEIGNSWKTDGNNWKGLEKLRGVEELERTAVMRESARNASLIREMVYAD